MCRKAASCWERGVGVGVCGGGGMLSSGCWVCCDCCDWDCDCDWEELLLLLLETRRR